MASKRRKSVKWTDLVEQMDRDPGSVARRAEQRRTLDERAAALAVAEEPIVRELRQQRVKCDSVWDLVNGSADDYRWALPVLGRHLELEYPERVLEGVARAIAVRGCSRYWDVLVRRYRSAEDRGLRDGLAVAVAAAAEDSGDKARLSDLALMVCDAALGSSRVLLVSTIARLGGEDCRRVASRACQDSEVQGELARHGLCG